MNTHHPNTDGLSLCAAKVRLIAGLMQMGTSLQQEEVETFSSMLLDIAVRIEHLTDNNRRNQLLVNDYHERGL